MRTSAENDVDEELRRVARRASKLLPVGAASSTVNPRAGLYVLRQSEPSVFEASIYEPMLCLILRGMKEMTFGERTHRLSEGQCALVSHDLPILSRVRMAPYLVVLLKVEVDVLRGLYEDVGELTTEVEARALEVNRADATLLDAVGRYMALSDSEVDARVLGPALLREIHYRLLASPLGHMLRRLLHHDSHASAVARALTRLRSDFRRPIAMEELARAVGMSVSAFHKHFKEVTASSPLQYQKNLRLLEARRLLLAGRASATTAAFEVGYESPTQFSREYSRKFGRPPSKDASAARGSRLARSR